MSRKTFGYGGIAVVLFIFIGALTGVVYQQSKDNTVQVNEESEESLASIDEGTKEEEMNSNIDIYELEEVTEVISTSHQALNVAVGWQAHQNFSWDHRKEELQSLITQTEEVVDRVSGTPLEQDFRNVLTCLDIALNEQDVNGVILAHRIMHDLDYYINGNEADGILYFVTHYGNDQNVDELYAYID